MSEEPEEHPDVVSTVDKKMRDFGKLLRVGMMAIGALGQKADGLIRQVAGLSRRTDRIIARITEVEDETLAPLRRTLDSIDKKLDQLLKETH